MEIIVSRTFLMMLLLQVQVFYGRGDVRLLDHDKVYQVITELIKEGKPEADAQNYNQFVSAVLMTEQEITNFNGDLGRFENRKGVYLNDDSKSDTGLRHKLLGYMDNFIQTLSNDRDRRDGSPPILVLFSYYISCDQSHHRNPTRCARDLRSWVAGTKGRGQTIQLFVSFLEVYYREVAPGIITDFTHLDKAVKHLMSPDICLTYIVPKRIPDNEPIPDVNLRWNLTDLSLSPCLEREGMVSHNLYTKHLFDHYATNRPKYIAQLILFKHIQKFLGGCIGTGNHRIIAFAVNFAFKLCIQDDKEGNDCRDERERLFGDVERSGNRQKLYKCLFENWVYEIGDYPSRCKGYPFSTVDNGVRTAVQDGATVGFPSRGTHIPEWDSIRGPWNVAIPPSFTRVRCPNRRSPEYLCTADPSSRSQSSSRSRSRSSSRSRSRSRERYRSRSRSRSPIYSNRV